MIIIIILIGVVDVQYSLTSLEIMYTNCIALSIA